MHRGKSREFGEILQRCAYLATTHRGAKFHRVEFILSPWLSALHCIECDDRMPVLLCSRQNLTFDELGSSLALGTARGTIMNRRLYSTVENRNVIQIASHFLSNFVLNAGKRNSALRELMKLPNETSTTFFGLWPAFANLSRQLTKIEPATFWEAISKRKQTYIGVSRWDTYAEVFSSF